MQHNKLFAQLPFQFNVNDFLLDLQGVREADWSKHPNKSAYEGNWAAMSLISGGGQTIRSSVVESQTTSLLQKMPYIEKIIADFKAPIEGVRLMRLGGNSTIKAYRDRGMHFDKSVARLHIPIATNNQVDFILDGEKRSMEAGFCYYIDADVSHSVINQSDQECVHLLIDCQINDWLKKVFIELGFKEKPSRYGDSVDDNNIDIIINSLKFIGGKSALKMAAELELKKANA